jgi:hypothetical protein
MVWLVLSLKTLGSLLIYIDIKLIYLVCQEGIPDRDVVFVPVYGMLREVELGYAEGASVEG